MEYCRISKREFPFWAMFCLFPVISIAVWQITGNEVVNYDVFWIPFCAVLSLYGLIRKTIIFKEQVKAYLIIGFLVILKYFIPWVDENILLTASLMDAKWLIYLFTAIVWLNSFGSPRIEKIYKYCIFFCFIYIAKALYMILTGQLSRSGVLMEANYDGYMILMVYCFSDVVKGKKWWWNAIIILTTLLTFSRTGWASFFAIMALKLFKKNILYVILLIPIVLVLIELGTDLRGESAQNMDRFVYWEQAIMYFRETSVSNVLLGSTPGVSLKMHILPEFVWTMENFEEMRNLRGIFPFMFHSTYLRLAITWGVFAALLYPAILICKFIKSKYTPLKLLCLITLIQSFSLSALTLQNVSFLLFVLFISSWRYDKKIQNYRYHKIIVNSQGK